MTSTEILDLAKQKARNDRAFETYKTRLGPRNRCAVPLGDDLSGIFGQLAGLRQKLKAFYHFRISFSLDPQSFFLAVCVNENFTLQIRANPLVVLQQVGFGVWDLVGIKRFAKLLQDVVIHFEVLGYLVSNNEMLGEVEKRIVL